MTQPNQALLALNEGDLWRFKHVIRDFTLAERNESIRNAAHEVWKATLDECERRINSRSTVLKECLASGGGGELH